MEISSAGKKILTCQGDCPFEPITSVNGALADGTTYTVTNSTSIAPDGDITWGEAGIGSSLTITFSSPVNIAITKTFADTNFNVWENGLIGIATAVTDGGDWVFSPGSMPGTTFASGDTVSAGPNQGSNIKSDDDWGQIQTNQATSIIFTGVAFDAYNFSAQGLNCQLPVCDVVDQNRDNINDVESRLFSGDYNDLDNIPSFATVATTGDFNDLVNVPVMGGGAVDSVNGQTGAVTVNEITAAEQAAIVANTMATAANATAISNNDADIASNAAGVSTNASDIANNVANIAANTSSISNNAAGISTNTSGIANNAANISAIVSADGPVSAHSDVDTAGAVAGNTLAFDGVNWVPQVVDNGFTVFPIWAEESADLANNTLEWAFGNGNDTLIGQGIVMPISAELFAMSLSTEASEAEVLAMQNGVNTSATISTVGTGSNNGFSLLTTPIQYNPGDYLNFRTVIGGGATNGGVVTAWFRVPTTQMGLAMLNDIMNVSAPSPQAGDELVYDGTQWVSQPQREVFDEYYRATVTDTTTNVNTATVTDIPFNGTSLTINDTGAFTSLSPTQIQINFTGFIEVHSDISYTSPGQRVALESFYAINGNSDFSVSSNDGYIRTTSGHNLAEMSLHDIKAVNAGDIFSIQARRESTIATASTLLRGRVILKRIREI